MNPAFNIRDGFLHSDENIVRGLLSHIVPLLATKRGYDASTPHSESISWTPTNTAQNLSVFDRNQGRFIDGRIDRLNLIELFVKVHTRLSLARDNGVDTLGPFKMHEIVKMTDRSVLELGSFDFYANGLKVPDDQIYVYMIESSTDILIPRKFIDPMGSNKFLVEKRIFPKHQYVSKLFRNANASSFQIQVDNAERDQSRFLSETALIFMNGELYGGTRTVTVAGNTVTISTADMMTGDVEIVFDSNIDTVNTQAQPAGSNYAMFWIPEGSSDLLNGPLARTACLFFMNGRRVSDADVTQVGRRNFAMIDSSMGAKTTTTILTDRGWIDDTQFRVFGQDYYLENMLGVEKTSRMMKGEIVNQTFTDAGVDANAIMNNGGQMYTDQAAKHPEDLIAKYPDPDVHTKEILSLEPSLVRDFLEYFGKKEIYVDVIVSGTPDVKYAYSFNTPKDPKKHESYLYMVDVDGVHVPDSKVKVVDNDTRDIIEIDGSVLHDGLNHIHLVEIRPLYNQGISYSIHEESEIQNVSGSLVCTIPMVSESTIVSDYCVLRQSQNEADTHYDPQMTLENGAAVGWKVKDDVNIQINASSRTMTIVFTTPPGGRWCLYSKRFAQKITKVIENDIQGIEDIAIPIRSGRTGNVPVIPKGRRFFVYLNGEFLLDNVDYIFKHPGNYRSVAYSVMIFRRKLHEGDVVDIVFTDQENTTVINMTGTMYNKYGMIYFGQLPFPYSPRYIDLFINGKLIHERDIEILGDRLIRVPNVSQPFFDVSAQTAFSVDQEMLQYFFERWVKSPLETALEPIFGVYNYMQDSNPSPGNIADLTYETLDDNVDHVAKAPNPTDETDHSATRFDVYVNAYLLWLNSNASKTIMNDGEDIHDEVIRYFGLYADENVYRQRADVVCSVDTNLFTNVRFTADNRVYPKERKVRELIRFAKRNNIGTDTLFQRYAEHLELANAIYPRDLPYAISAETRVDGTDISLGDPSSQIA